MRAIVPTALCALSALIALPALWIDVRNGLRYGWCATESGCAPGTC